MTLAGVLSYTDASLPSVYFSTKTQSRPACESSASDPTNGNVSAALSEDTETGVRQRLLAKAGNNQIKTSTIAP